VYGVTRDRTTTVLPTATAATVSTMKPPGQLHVETVTCVVKITNDTSGTEIDYSVEIEDGEIVRYTRRLFVDYEQQSFDVYEGANGLPEYVIDAVEAQLGHGLQ